ncbi:MAG: redoxin domain-containing protein [Prevotella sp.]|nr:redoxin domain-containing protein [Prevotella sp.]
MKKSGFKVIAITMIALALGACSKEKFHVKGVITNAKDSVLYFENMSLDGAIAIDSAKLNESGAFDFAGEASEAPEFYRLRIANQIINISVDSTETISVGASYPTMATQYKVSGSENCERIRQLALKQIDLQNKAIAIQQDNALNVQTANDSIVRLVEAYKDVVKRDFIYKEPMMASSYFALFQTLGNLLIFNPRENKEDIKAFAAVATSWDTYYPHALRGQNLHNIAIEGMKNVRILEGQKQQVLDLSKVSTSTIIDIELQDNKGTTRRLSDLKGKVVMLDFHVFAAKESAQRIMQLRDLYNKYHAQGFEIYQVSLDPDEHFWKQQTAALPWISVRDPQGLNSVVLTHYNVQAIPTFYLIDKTNTLDKRDVQIKDLDKEIQSLL